jgi:polar amino acid transport system substrate-binding protein
MGENDSMKQVRFGLAVVLALITVTTEVSATPGPIKLVFFEDYAPFSYREDGVLKGIYIDMAREIFEKNLKIPVSVEGYPWARAQTMVQQGLADGFFTVPTDERRVYAEVVAPAVLENKFVLYTSRTNPELPEIEGVRTLAEAKKFRQAAYLGSGWAKVNLDPQMIDWSPTLESMLPLITGKTRYVLIDVDLVVNRVLRKMGQMDRVWMGPVLDTAPIHVFLGKKSGFVGLVPQVSRVITELKASGRLDALAQIAR